MQFFKEVFSPSKNIPKKPSPPARKRIEDVKADDVITIEWYRFANSGIGKTTCINNDPKTRKILLQVRWSNFEQYKINEYESIILDYDDFKLKNFHLLNSTGQQENVKQEYNLSDLQKKMNEALDAEKYEEADKLQKQIDKLVNKK